MTDISNSGEIVKLAEALKEIEENIADLGEERRALKAGAKDLGIDVAAASALVKIAMMSEDKRARLAERNEALRSYGEVLEIDPFP